MRALSGTQPTQNALHLGNYFGALRQYVALQEQYGEALYFVAQRGWAEEGRNFLDSLVKYLGKGLSVDGAGRIWRAGGSGAVRFDSDLGTSSCFSGYTSAYTYSDMTGFGIANTAGLFLRILDHSDFCAGDIDTGFIDRYFTPR